MLFALSSVCLRPGVGDHADTVNLDEYGIEKNLRTQGDKYKKEALDLLSRGISIEQTLDRKGIYGKGGDDLQKDPMAAYGLSRPTKRIKAFISHTWDATDAAGKSPSAIAADRLNHADNTTKAVSLVAVAWSHAVPCSPCPAGGLSCSPQSNGLHARFALSTPFPLALPSSLALLRSCGTSSLRSCSSRCSSARSSSSLA